MVKGHPIITFAGNYKFDTTRYFVYITISIITFRMRKISANFCLEDMVQWFIKVKAAHSNGRKKGMKLIKRKTEGILFKSKEIEQSSF